MSKNNLWAKTDSSYPAKWSLWLTPISYFSLDSLHCSGICFPVVRNSGPLRFSSSPIQNSFQVQHDAMALYRPSHTSKSLQIPPSIFIFSFHSSLDCPDHVSYIGASAVTEWNKKGAQHVAQFPRLPQTLVFFPLCSEEATAAPMAASIDGDKWSSGFDSFLLLSDAPSSFRGRRLLWEWN